MSRKAMMTSSQVGDDSPSSDRSMEIVMLSCLIDSSICIVFWFEQNYAGLLKNYAHLFLVIDNEKMSKTKKHNMMASYNMQGSTLMFVLFVLLIIFECESRAHWFRTHLNRFYDD